MSTAPTDLPATTPSGVAREVGHPVATKPDSTTELQGRARRLRSQADSLHPLLAQAYRRRAAELDLQAWLEAVWNPPIDLRDAPLTNERKHLVVPADRRPQSAVA